jgi:hypothetical protein
MQFKSARLAQQIRLWLYCTIEVIIVARAMSGRGDLASFVIFMLVGALFYIEICPVCGRLCWWELNALKKWPNALWIGRECRLKHSQQSASVSHNLGNS